MRLINSIRARFGESEIYLFHGDFLGVTSLDRMSFSTSLSWDLIQRVCILCSFISWLNEFLGSVWNSESSEGSVWSPESTRERKTKY